MTAPWRGWPRWQADGRMSDGRRLAYHELHEGGDPGLWRPLVGVLVLIAVVFVAVPVGMLVPFVAYYLLSGAPFQESLEGLVDLSDPTPAGLAYLNLTLASAIPVTWFLSRFLHGLKPRWLASVRPRIRWYGSPRARSYAGGAAGWATVTPGPRTAARGSGPDRGARGTRTAAATPCGRLRRCAPGRTRCAA